jgi:hypothetical protein
VTTATKQAWSGAEREALFQVSPGSHAEQQKQHADDKLKQVARELVLGAVTLANPGSVAGTDAILRPENV